MKKRLLSFLLAAALLVSLAACGGGKSPDQPSEEAPSELIPGDTTPRTDGNWELTGEWSILREKNGDEILSVSAAGASTARNTFFRLLDQWSVWVDLQVTQPCGESDKMGLIFTDEAGEILLSLTAELAGGKVWLSGWVQTRYGQKEILSDEAPTEYDPSLPLNLKVERRVDIKRLTVTLSQNGQELHSLQSRSIENATFSAMTRPGLQVDHTQGSFSDFSVQAEKKTVDTDRPIDGIFEAEENVPTEEWILGEGAVHNLLDGKSALVIEGEKQHYAWNAVNTLGDEWTLSFSAEYGRSSREVGCARFIFGPEAGIDAPIYGLVTINYTNKSVNLTVQDLDGGSWVTTATSMGWIEVSSRTVRVEIAKYAGINRLAVFLYDGVDLIYSTFSDEMRPEQMANYRHYGCAVYASQLRFGGFGMTESANEDIMPSMAEKVYPHVSVLEVPEGQRTSDWELSRNAVYFREEGKDALIINSKGEEYCYYVKNTISGAWSCSTQLNFGTYYAESAGLRISFSTTDKRYAALLSLSYNPAGGAYDIQLQSYIPQTDGWEDLIRSGWTPGAPGSELFLSGDGQGSFTLSLRESGSGKLIYENTVTLEDSTLKNMKLIGFAAMNSQTKFSAITMDLTGPRAQLPKNPSQKTMYGLYVGTPATTDRWSMGEGITYNTEGALILSSREGVFSHELKTEILDGFEITTDILFGNLDAAGCSTPRVALTDSAGNLLVLISVKFAQNFYVMTVGQYNHAGQWHSPLNDGQWREVTDNRVHLRLSRAPESNRLELRITDFAGRSVYSAYMDLPQALSAQIAGYSLGVDNSGAKFSNMSCTLSGRTTKPENPEDFGLVPLPETQAAQTDRWVLDTGASYRSDGSLLIEGDAAFARDQSLAISNGFHITADIHYGSIDGNGVSTSRLALLDRGSSQLVLFSLKYSVSGHLMVVGQYWDGGWKECITDTAWRSVKDNRIHLDLQRLDNSGDLYLTLSDYSGREIFSAKCDIPYALAQQLTGYALGVDQSTVRFSEIYSYASDSVLPEQPPEGEEENPDQGNDYGETVEPVGWTSADGICHLADGSIVAHGQGDVFTYCTGQPLGENYDISARILFGAKGSDGTATARVVLTASDLSPVGLISMKLDGQNNLMLMAQLYHEGSWSTILNVDWMNIGTDEILLNLRHVAGENLWQLQITDAVGTVLWTGSTAEILPEATAAVQYFGLGSYSSEVKYRDISIETY